MVGWRGATRPRHGPRAPGGHLGAGAAGRVARGARLARPSDRDALAGSWAVPGLGRKRAVPGLAASAGLGREALAAAVLDLAAGPDGRADRLAALDRANPREPAARVAARRDGRQAPERRPLLLGRARGVRRR